MTRDRGAKRSPTVVDIARVAGVSIGTVSNVLTSAKPVSPQTRASVERAIVELGYRHNHVAASLRAQASKAVCLVLPDVGGRPWGELARGAADVLGEDGYAVLLYNSDGEGESESASLRDAHERRLDGVLAASSVLGDAERLDHGSLPTVTVMGAVTAAADHVDAADAYGGALAADLLVQLGHRDLVVLAGASTAEAERRAGFVERAQGHGATVTALPVTVPHARGPELFRLLDGATAGFCASDGIAGELVDALRRSGARVPQQFSVVGYHGTSATGTTSVRPPAYALGASAARLLLQRLRRPDSAPQTLTLRPRMLEGTTVAHWPTQGSTRRARRLGERTEVVQFDYEAGRRSELALHLAQRFAGVQSDTDVTFDFRPGSPLPYERGLREALAGPRGAPGRPHVFHSNGGYLTAPLVAQGVVLPLSEFAEEHGWEQRVIGSLLREGRYSPDGLRWGDPSAPLYTVSYYAEVLGLLFDPRTLERLGVGMPRTLGELEETLAAAKDAGMVGLVLADDDGIGAVHLLEALLARLLPADSLRDVVFGRGANLDSDRAREALETIARWARRGYLAPVRRELTAEGALERFAAGEALFLLADASQRLPIGQHHGHPLTFALVPPEHESDPPHAIGSGGGALGLVAHAANVEASARWIDFLLGPDAAAIVQSYGLTPLAQPPGATRAGSDAADAADVAVRELLERDGLVYYPSVATPTMLERMRGVIADVVDGGSSADGVEALRADLSGSLAQRAGWI